MFQVSQTKVKAYQKCRMAYQLRYVEKLRRKIKGRPLVFGDILHQLIECGIEDEDWEQRLVDIEKDQGKMFAAEREMYGEILEDARLIFEAYLEYWKDDDLKYLRFNRRKSEHWLEIEIADGILLVLKIDCFGSTRPVRSRCQRTASGETFRLLCI